MKATFTKKTSISAVFAIFFLLNGAHKVFAQSAVEDGFRQGFKAASERQAQQSAAEEQARREAAQQAAEQERQRQAYDLQLRNQREMEALRQQQQLEDQKRREDEQRLREVDARRARWNQAIEELKNNFATIYNLALTDASNNDYSPETKAAAREAMTKLSQQKLQLYSIEPNVKDEVSFSESFSKLPAPQLGYTVEYSKEYLTKQKKTSSKKQKKHSSTN